MPQLSMNSKKPAPPPSIELASSTSPMHGWIALPSLDLSCTVDCATVPCVFSYPPTKSTYCSFFLACPSKGQDCVAFSSLSTLAFVQDKARNRAKNASRSRDAQLLGSSLTSAFATVWGSLFSFEKPSINFNANNCLATAGPSGKLAASTDVVSPRKSAWHQTKSQILPERGLEERSKVSLGNGLQAHHKDLPDRATKVQKGVHTSAEKAQNIAKHLVAGAISTIVSRTFVAPLERLKLEYIVGGAKLGWVHVIHGIWCTEGVGGFWKGNMLNLLRMVPFKCINFLAYDLFCKEMLERQGKAEMTNFDRLTAGAASGAAATLMCFPLDTIRTRLIAPGGEALGGMLGCCKQMIHNEGSLSLYKGLLPALLSMVPSGAVFYGVYDILKAAYLQSPKAQKAHLQRIEDEKSKEAGMAEGGKRSQPQQVELGPVRTLVYGAIAGACAEMLMYPLEVVRRQLQLQQSASKMGLIAAFHYIVERDGLGALFSGVIPSTIQVLPSAALSYLVYESMKSMLKV